MLRGAGRTVPGRTAAAAIVALLAGVTGCAPTSDVAPTATVAVHGRVLAPDGSPAVGVRVGLAKQLDAGEALGGLFVVGVSLGLACFGGGPNVPDLCAHQPSTVTGGAGDFRFDLRGSDTQGSFGRASTFSIVASLPPRAGELAGPSTEEDLELQATDLEVPSLRLWRPAVTITPAGGAIRLDWQAPSSDYGGSPGYDVRFQDAQSLPIWTFTGAAPAETFDARPLEDTRGGAIVEAHTEMPATKTTARLAYRSAALAYRGTAGAPASRGRPCAVSRGAGLEPLSPCPLTDGDLVHPAAIGSLGTAPSGASPATATPHARIDMGAPVPVTLVVVRGCSGCRVEGSIDGVAWSPVGAPASDPGSVEPPGGRAVMRYVRAGGAGLQGVREISVWTGDAAPGARAGGGSAGGSGGLPAGTGPATDFRPLAIGLVALAAAVAALAVVLARRRVTLRSRP